MHPSNSRRQINNELAARGMNQQIKKSIEAHTPKEEHAKIQIEFHCECADADCHERVELTLEEYHKLHEANDQFVIAKGHVAPVIEKIVEDNSQFQVVKKYAL